MLGEENFSHVVCAGLVGSQHTNPTIMIGETTSQIPLHHISAYEKKIALNIAFNIFLHVDVVNFV